MGRIEKKEIWSIPNCMGYFRILLIPVFCWAYFKAGTPEEHFFAAGILLVSSVTDLLDGKIARRFHMVTELGKFVDPLADKLTHGAVALCLVFRYEPMKYLFGLMLLKEGFMAAMGLRNLRHGKKLDGAKWFGKVCTATLFVLLWGLVLFPGISEKTAEGLIFAEMGIMGLTLLLYAGVFYKMRKTWEKPGEKQTDLGGEER